MELLEGRLPGFIVFFIFSFCFKLIRFYTLACRLYISKTNNFFKVRNVRGKLDIRGESEEVAVRY